MKFEPSIKASHPRGSGDLVNSLDSPANTARRAWRFRGNDIRVILVAALVIMCGIFASCGSDNLAIAPSGNLTIEPDNLPINLQVDSEAQGIASSAAPSSATTTPADRRNDKELNGYWHKFVYSDNYTGEIAVMFKDGTDMRDYLPTEDVRRGVQRFTEEQVNEAIERAGRRGIALNNWSQFFIIKERDPARAEAILVELANSRAVKWVQPHLLPQLSDAGSTANIVEDQDYLYPNETHGGLNVVAGWEAGAYGEDIVLADLEINWNFTHEDLGIAEADICYDDGELPSNPSDAKYVNHGTAVVGILSGSDNGIGIDGIASKAKIKLFKGSLAVLYDIIFGLLPPCSDGTTFKPGDVIVIELQMKGNIASKCDIGDLPSGTATGCVPMEAWPEFYDFVADAVKLGYVIIEGAGNGAVDLGSPEAHIESGPDLSIDNSGAIMVGASMGANHEKAWYSNCGNRLDVYAWGAGVVTAGYGDHPASDPNDPNKWYTKQFDGTSSATAIIGGVAAQLQSYVKKVYAPNARLTPKQMKDLLIASGVPAVGDENCNIGVQPDVGKAIEMLNNGTFAPEFEVLPLDPASEDVVSGIRYDMDNDNRAELISFSRDHKWYIDLSGTPCTSGATCGDDGYGAWDLILNIPSPLMGEGKGGGDSEGSMLFPVVHDYNSDGRADLALYDSINGKYYIKYTTSALITPSPLVGEGGGEGVIEWDRIIDYASDPAWKPYSRPVPGDYDGDNWLDPALQTPDGHWLIDYGGFDGVKLSVIPAEAGISSIQYLDHFGSFDKDVKYLTDEQLAQAPGWAWLPSVIRYSGLTADGFILKVPDGIQNEYQILKADAQNFEILYDGFPPIYGDSSTFIIPAKYNDPNNWDSLGIKDNANAQWNVIFEGNNLWGKWDDPVFAEYQVNDIFGDINCRPIPADYDGDGKDDRAVQCGTMWKIAYSSDATASFREVELTDVFDPVPAYAYAGGIKYQDQVDLYNYYKTELGGTKDSTIFDSLPPIGPYFAQCVKYWAPNASYCWDK